MIIWDIFQLTNWYRYQFVAEVRTDMWSIKEMIQFATLGSPKGMKKWNFYFYRFFPWPFDQKWKYNFREVQNNKQFEIILHVGRVTSLQSWKSIVRNRKFICKGLTMTWFLATQLWHSFDTVIFALFSELEKASDQLYFSILMIPQNVN